MICATEMVCNDMNAKFCNDWFWYSINIKVVRTTISDDALLVTDVRDL
jgi:hypothetical protein